MSEANLYNMFEGAACRYPEHAALKYKKQGQYAEIRYGELLQSIRTAADNFARLGVSEGDRVGIFSCNRPEWAVCDLALLKLGAIVVPIYPSTSASILQYIINDSRMKLIVVENHVLAMLVASVRSQTPTLRTCITMESQKDGESDSPDFNSELCQPGTSAEENHRVSEQDIATIVYTSGTTGNPKGVMLTHANIVSNAQAVISRFRVTSTDIVVSYLPLCHMFERTCGYYAILFSGGAIAYAENLTTVADDVARTRPTILIAVPRIIEKAFEKAVAGVKNKSLLGQWLVSSAMRNLNTRANLEYRKKRVPYLLRAKCAVLDRIVASTFRQLAGGRLRLIASGGAPLDRKIAKAFHILGFNIVEGYGLTETSPVVSCNAPCDNTLGTVGKPMDGVQIRIGEKDEIQVKGPNVMRGYLNDPAATAEVLDGEGWLHTGDQGRFDERGNLVITGRIKDLIITSYGKNVPATAIETKILQSPYVSQIVVFGDKRKYITALVMPDQAAVENWALRRGITSSAFSTLVQHEEIRRLIAQEIDEATRDCTSYEKIKAFRLITEEFTADNGLLTPTLKTRRKAIAEKYHELIDSMYKMEENGTRRQ
jgi:long-chain acyl-CoA synthetase